MPLCVRSLRLIIITSSSCRRGNDVLWTKTPRRLEVHVPMCTSGTAWLGWAWHLNSTTLLSDVLMFESCDIIIILSRITYNIVHIIIPTDFLAIGPVWRDRLKYKNNANPTYFARVNTSMGTIITRARFFFRFLNRFNNYI